MNDDNFWCNLFRPDDCGDWNDNEHKRTDLYMKGKPKFEFSNMLCKSIYHNNMAILNGVILVSFSISLLGDIH